MLPSGMYATDNTGDVGDALSGALQQASVLVLSASSFFCGLRSLLPLLLDPLLQYNFALCLALVLFCSTLCLSCFHLGLLRPRLPHPNDSAKGCTVMAGLVAVRRLHALASYA